MSNRTTLEKLNLVDRRLVTLVSQALPSGLSDQQIKKLLANAGALHSGLRLLLNADITAIDGEMFAHVVAGGPAKIKDRHSFSRETLKTLGQQGYIIATIPAGLNMSSTLTTRIQEGVERPYILDSGDLSVVEEVIEEVPTLFSFQVAWNPECPSEESSKWGYVTREEWFKSVGKTLPLDCEAREPTLEEAGCLLRSYFAEYAKLPWEGHRNFWCLNSSGPNSRLVMFQEYRQDFVVSFRGYTLFHGDIGTLAIVVPKRLSLASLKA